MIFLFMLHKAHQVRRSVQALLSRPATSGACGQSSKPQKSFACAFHKGQEAFCLSSVLRSPLVKRAILLGQERERGEKPLKVLSLNRDRDQAAPMKHAQCAVKAEAETKSEHVFVSHANHLKHQTFSTF